MTVNGQQNRKRKLSASPAQLKSSKVEISTPKATPKNSKNAALSTPQTKTPQQKSAQKGKTPQQQRQKNTPKSAKNSANKKQAAKSKTPVKQEIEEESDDDDEDIDEEEDSEDDIDEEGSDEEDEDKTVAQPSNKKMKLSSPVKEETSPSKAQSQQPKGKAQKQIPSKNTVSQIQNDSERKADLDSRTLFVKNLPGNCSVKEIKALSGDIKLVRLRINANKFNKKQGGSGFAYVEFASEEVAEKNFPVLTAASIKGNKLAVDYVGPKSTFKKDKVKTEADTQEIDPLKLYVAGLSPDVTESDLRKIFPKAKEIIVPMRRKDKKAFGYAFINFATAQLAKEYHDKTQEVTLKGMTLVVLHAKKRKPEQEKTKKQAEKKQQKQKKEVKKPEPVKMETDDKAVKEDDEEEEEEDDDDDEEEEEEEDDDEEGESADETNDDDEDEEDDE